MDNLRRRFNTPTKVGSPSSPTSGRTEGNSNGGGGSITIASHPDGEMEPPEIPAEGGGGSGGSNGERTHEATEVCPTVDTSAWGPDAVRGAEAHILEHLRGVDAFCGTGAAAVGRLAALLAGTRYGHVSEQCRLRLEDVQRATKAEVAQVATEVKVTLSKISPKVDETVVSEEDVKVGGCSFLVFTNV